MIFNIDKLEDSTQKTIAKAIAGIILVIAVISLTWLVFQVFDYFEIDKWLATPVTELNITHLLIIGILIASFIRVK